MSEINLNARLRHEKGTGAAHRLLAAGHLPGVFYLGHEMNFPIALNAHELQLALKKKPQLIRLQLDSGAEYECVIREIQRDPLSGRILHIDLMGIVSTEKVTIKVEVELTGSCHGVRVQGGIVQQSFHTLHVECLPHDIPTKIVVDITDLHVGHSVHVRDLKPESYRVVEESDITLVTVLAPKVEKAAEVTAEAVPVEGAAPAEGEVAEKS